MMMVVVLVVRIGSAPIKKRPARLGVEVLFGGQVQWDVHLEPSQVQE